MSATTIRDENAFEATLSAVIIYDKCDFAAKAKAMLEQAANRSDETTVWNLKPWRMDMLAIPPAAEAALVEAAEAHLIVLAVHPVQPLLIDWLERWAKCRQVQEAALAVWDGGNTDSLSISTRAIPELSQFAGRLGLSLIFGNNALVEDKSPRIASDLRKREAARTPTLRQFPEQPLCDPGQHWGIND
jgi:hypothetical protein